MMKVSDGVAVCAVIDFVLSFHIGLACAVVLVGARIVLVFSGPYPLAQISGTVVVVEAAVVVKAVCPEGAKRTGVAPYVYVCGSVEIFIGRVPHLKSICAYHLN
jgi:hypothetical protein